MADRMTDERLDWFFYSTLIDCDVRIPELIQALKAEREYWSKHICNEVELEAENKRMVNETGMEFLKDEVIAVAARKHRELKQHIVELEEIINKASSGDFEQTSDPQTDNSYTGQIAQLQAQIETLKPYTKHDLDCSWVRISGDCECGLAAALGQDK